MDGTTVNGGSGPRDGGADVGEPFGICGGSAVPLVATAIHAGHDLRPEVARLVQLDELTRLREEDPFTDRIARCADSRVIVHRSRFEVDLNRSRDGAVYRTPDDCWGLDVWREPLPDAVVARSLDVYDSFYESLGSRLDPLAARGPFVVFDVHSYNHRQQGPEASPAPAAENPDINVGTGSMDRGRWAPVVGALIDALDGAEVCGEPIDVRENVRFEGANLARWVHERYPATGCALALEFKKTFMDEWTGHVDERRVDALADTLTAAVPAVLDALDGLEVFA
jgi:N-formylglutamate amidohydrolase